MITPPTELKRELQDALPGETLAATEAARVEESVAVLLVADDVAKVEQQEIVEEVMEPLPAGNPCLVSKTSNSDVAAHVATPVVASRAVPSEDMFAFAVWDSAPSIEATDWRAQYAVAVAPKVPQMMSPLALASSNAKLAASTFSTWDEFNPRNSPTRMGPCADQELRQGRRPKTAKGRKAMPSRCARCRRCLCPRQRCRGCRLVMLPTVCLVGVAEAEVGGGWRRPPAQPLVP